MSGNNPETTRRIRRRAQRLPAMFAAIGLGLAALSSTVPANAAAFGEIDDPGLAKCVNTKLNRDPATPITATELAGLSRTLECDIGDQVRSLDGLELATRLWTLNIFAGSNDLSAPGALDAIGKLPELKELRLNGVKVTDASLAGIAGAGTLTILDIDNSPGVTSLEPVRGLTNISRLTAQKNAITSLEPISGLTKLELLGVADNAIPSLEPLAAMKDLGVLTATNNSITSLDGLEDLSKLTELWVNENPLGGQIDALRGKPLLISLNITNTGVTSLLPIADSTALTTLQANRNHIADLSGLVAYPGSGSHLVDFQDLAGPTLFVPADATSIRFDISGNHVLRDGVTLASIGGAIVPTPDPEVPIVTMNVNDPAMTQLQYTFREAPTVNNVYGGAVTMPIVRVSVTNEESILGTAEEALTGQVTVTEGFPASDYQLGDDAPAWLSIDPATGKLSGTPPEAGTVTVTVTVTDALGNRVTGEITIEVEPATPPTTTPPTTTPPTTAPPTTTVPPTIAPTSAGPTTAAPGGGQKPSTGKQSGLANTGAAEWAPAAALGALALLGTGILVLRRRFHA